jgi:hypothetical protein
MSVSLNAQYKMFWSSLSFSSPGTTVHPDWHRFLDNSFSTFNPNEYVALLLSEEQMNKDEYTPSVYVYAIIIRHFLVPYYCIFKH